MKTILGIDAGTTSIKAGLFTPDGHCLAVSRQEYHLDTPRPNWAELDPEIYWQGCVAAIRQVLDQSGQNEIASISISSQGETLIALDRQGKPVYPAIVWLDNRAESEARILAEVFSQEVYAKTGIPEIIPTWTACKILWLRNHEPKIFDRIEKFMLVQDYLIYRLTDEHTTNLSIACTSLLVDIVEGTWWDEVLSFIGIDQQKLPALIPTGQIAGKTTAVAADQTGIPESTIVIGSGMDQSVGAIGAGNIREGIVSETTGSALTIQVTIPSPDVDRNKVIPVYSHSMPGQYLFVPVCPTGGMALKWLRDTFAEPEIEKSKKDGSDPYDLLTALASVVPPGSDGLVMLPHLMGAYSPNPNPSARGSFTGFSLSHTRGHFVRAVLEGVAFLLKQNLDVLQTAGISISEIRSTGGGARSRLWNQIKANVCNVPVLTFQNEDTALLGDAILGGVASGIFSSIEEGCERMIFIADKFVPDAQAASYVAAYQRYCDLDQNLSGFFRRQY